MSPSTSEDVPTVAASLRDQEVEKAASSLTREQLEALIGYWSRGHAIVEGRLAKAVRADISDIPMDLDPANAKAWHRMRAEIFRDVLDMMGIPEGMGLPVPAAGG